MPSFGVSSSMPPGSSSLSPCISNLVSSNASSGPETSCAPLPEGCVSHLFGPPHLPPPPPLSLSDAAPYSPPPAYPPVFPFGPPLLPSARFPPPPNPSFGPPFLGSYFEGPQSPYPPEPHPSYDRWSDRSMNSSSYGRDHIPKSFSHWPLPTFNSGININGNSNNNPTMGFLKPETLFPPIAPYPPVDSVTNFGPKFSPLSGFPNAAGMPSTPSTSITSPLASSHFGAFPPPNLPLDFPNSCGRFPFNPHASTFHPNMDPPPAFAPGTAEFMPEPVPSYLSRHGPYQPSSSFQAPDHFHDPSAHTILSPDTIPRPVTSDSLSSFYFPPQTFHGSSDFLSHTFSSRSDIAPSPIGSSEGPPVLDFFAPFNSPYPPPLPGSLCSPFPSGPPPLYQEPTRNPVGTSGPQRDEDLRDGIVGETGKLMYQHLSPEEWRWKYYEPSFADAVDPSGVFARFRASGYNSFHGVDSTVYSAVPNSSSGFVLTEGGSSSGGSKSESEEEDILERSKAQNQSGPSLKLAASALAEMLASGSNGASVSTSRSMLSQVEANTGTSITFDGCFQSENSSGGGQAKTERALEDCCSSSGSAVFRKEGRDGCGCLGHECGGLTAEGYVSGLNLGSPTRSKREMLDLDSFCDFGGAIGWPLPKAAGHTENSATLRPMSWVDPVVPQSAKGGAMPSNGQRRVFSKGSAGIMKQPSGTTTGSAKAHEASASSNSALEDYNIALTQSSNLSSRPPSGSVMRNVYPPLGIQPSDDPASVVAPFPSTVSGTSGLSLFGPHHELSSAISNELSLDPPHNDQRRGNSTSCGSSPPLSQAHLEQQRSLSGTTIPTTETASGFLANLKWSCPESSSQTEVTYLGTGFQSLTASISNLSKVLFSLDSAALTPPDAATLEETLQSSILRLSECLLLEQSRTNKNPATRFVGSDESSASRQGRAEGHLPDFDTSDHHAETVGSANFSQLKEQASEVGVIPNSSRSGSPSQHCNVNDRRATSTGVPVEIFDCNWNAFQGPSPSNNDTHSVPKCASNDVGVNYDPRRPSFSQHKGAVGDDIIQFLRENDILERSSLERLIGAEAREASLKALVDELREELELERVENRGTALLCEKIMQEAEISKGRAAMQGAQKADSGSKKQISTLDRSCKSEASGFDRQPNLTRHEQGRPDELGEETNSTAQVNSGEEPFLNEIDQVESRLALLRARSPLTPQPNISNGSSESELGEDIDAVASRESSSENVLDNSDHGESRLKIRSLFPLCPEPRSALLQTRPTAMHEYPSYDANRDVSELMPYLIEPSNQDTTLDGVEARLALIHGRPGWDNNDLGVFTETEPCTPALDLESGRGSFPLPSLSGYYEDRVAFADRALKAMNQITSQLLIQSETISDMHTAWSQFSEQVNPKKESMTELQEKEACIQAVEARALKMKSRPDWTDGDASESETEDFLGGQVYKVPSTNSGGVRYESDQFEMMNEISLVRLLDSDVELSQPLGGTTTADCQILQGAIGDTSSRAESSNLESGNPTPAQDVDDDDSDSWEHVRFDQKDSE